MTNKKLLLYYNTAPHYRTSIFCKIDKEYDCDWYFGETVTDIKEMDLSLLKSVKKFKTIGDQTKLCWTTSLIPQLFKKKYQTFFVLSWPRSMSMWVFLFLAKVFFPNKRVYSWSHGWYGKESKTVAALKRWMDTCLTGRFVYGEHAKQLMIEQGIDKDKIFVIKNSLDYDRQLSLRNTIKPSEIYREHFGNDNPVIVFIGRLTKIKHLDVLLAAINLLKQKQVFYNLVFIGDGSERGFLESVVKDKNLSDQVWFYGACYDEKQNSELIYNSDLCVSPGNVGLTAMHTLVFGTPVITHNNFALQMPEYESIIPSVTGDFFEYGSLESLADVIQSWFDSHKDKREEVRQACYKEIDTYWNPEYQMEIIKKN